MKSSILFNCSALVLILFCTNSIAAKNQTNSHAGWHVGINNGLSVINTQERGGSSNDNDDMHSLSNRSYTGGVYLGYDWGLSPHWLLGVEGGYQYLGESEWHNDKVNGANSYQVIAKSQIRAINALLTGKYYLTNNFDLFGKLGVAYEWLHRSVTCESGDCLAGGALPVSGRADETRFYLNPELQMGFGWNMTKALNLNLAYQRIFGQHTRSYNNQSSQDDNHINPSIDSLLLGVDYHFHQVPGLAKVTRTHQGGWHVGVNSGLSVINTQERSGSDADDDDMYSLSNRSYTGGAYLGYDWALTKRWLLGVETGFQYLGESEWHNDDLDSTPSESFQVTVKNQLRAVNALLTSKYYLTNSIDLFGKLGVAYEWSHRSALCSSGDCQDEESFPANVDRADDTKFYLNPEVQMGLGWNMTNALNMNLAYQHIFGQQARSYNTQSGQNDNHTNPTINSLLLGIDYHFYQVPGLAKVTHMHHGGWHVGVNSGLSVINTQEMTGSDSDEINLYSLHNRSYTGGAYLGYDWGLTKRWLLGVETGYQYLGKSEWNYDDVDSDPGESFQLLSKNQIRAVNALLTSKYYLTNSIDLFGKLGVAYEWLHRSVVCNSGDCQDEGSLPADSNRADGTRFYLNPELQAGLGWNITKALNVNVAYQQVFGQQTQAFNSHTSDIQANHVNPSIDSFLFGIDYQFNQVPGLANVTRAHYGGWHVGVNSGLSVIDTRELNSADTEEDYAYSLSNRSYTGGAYLSYDWGLTKRWLLGVESGYQYLGHSNWHEDFLDGADSYAVKANSQIRAVDALLTAKYYLTNSVNLFGKLGVAYEWLHRNVVCQSGNCNVEDGLPASGRTDETRFYLNPELQMGLGWNITKHLNLNVAYQRVFGQTTGSVNEQGRDGKGDNGYTYDTHINPTIDSFLFGIDYQFSQVPGLATVMRIHHGGWHIGVNNGLSVINTLEQSASDGDDDDFFSLSNRSYTGSIYVGHDWNVSKTWLVGIQTGYQYLGHSEWRADEVDGADSYQVLARSQIRAVNLLLTNKYYLTNDVDVFGNLGVAYEWLHRNVTCESGDCTTAESLPASGRADGTRFYLNPELQAGLGWNVTKALNLNIAYQRVFGQKTAAYQDSTGHDDTHINPTIDSVLLGVDYHFA